MGGDGDSTEQQEDDDRKWMLAHKMLQTVTKVFNVVQFTEIDWLGCESIGSFKKN